MDTARRVEEWLKETGCDHFVLPDGDRAYFEIPAPNGDPDDVQRVTYTTTEATSDTCEGARADLFAAIKRGISERYGRTSAGAQTDGCLFFSWRRRPEVGPAEQGGHWRARARWVAFHLDWVMARDSVWPAVQLRFAQIEAEDRNVAPAQIAERRPANPDAERFRSSRWTMGLVSATLDELGNGEHLIARDDLTRPPLKIERLYDAWAIIGDGASAGPYTRPDFDKLVLAALTGPSSDFDTTELRRRQEDRCQGGRRDWDGWSSPRVAAAAKAAEVKRDTTLADCATPAEAQSGDLTEADVERIGKELGDYCREHGPIAVRSGMEPMCWRSEPFTKEEFEAIAGGALPMHAALCELNFEEGGGKCTCGLKVAARTADALVAKRRSERFVADLKEALNSHDWRINGNAEVCSRCEKTHEAVLDYGLRCTPATTKPGADALARAFAVPTFHEQPMLGRVLTKAWEGGIKDADAR